MGIDLRTHLISIVAIFLALGIGILVGVDMIGGRGIVAQEHNLVTRLEKDFSQLRNQNTHLQSVIAGDDQTLAYDREFAQSVTPVVVAGRLKGQVVALIVSEGSVDPSSLVRVLREAGARVSPILTMPPEDEVKAAARQEAASLLAEASGDAVYPALGAALAHALAMGTPGILQEMEGTGILHGTETLSGPATSVLLVMGRPGQKDALAKDFGVPLVKTLKAEDITVTEAETSSVSQADSTIPLFDTLGIATVDDIDTPAGQISAVWGLSGANGTWGIKPGAQAFMPSLETAP